MVMNDLFFLIFLYKFVRKKISTFSYYLICGSHTCQEGKKLKVLLNKYDDNDNYLLMQKEKKELSFLCMNCAVLLIQ